MLVTIKKLPKSEVEIEGELEAEAFESYFKATLKKIGQHFELDGFRKGKIPESVLISKVPEIRILEEMAELALTEHYPKILEEKKIDAIGRPEISITKLARKNPLGFKIKVSILPDIKLGNYKKIAQKITRNIKPEEKDFVVSDKDLENTIMDIRKSRAPKVRMAEEIQVSDTKNPVSDTLNLPEFDDDFVKGLGPFLNIEDFKNKLRENIKLEKQNAAKEKIRLKIIEKIIDDSVLELPEVLTEVELDKILYRMESDITAMGLKFEDYLKHLNKKVEDLRKEFRTDAEKKAKLGLILNEIAKIEKITAPEEEVIFSILAISYNMSPSLAF